MLAWNSTKPKPAFLSPDQINHFQHDAPEGFSMLVVSASGEQVCGRVVHNATGKWVHVLSPEWELK
jgi:hypothetical protein